MKSVANRTTPLPPPPPLPPTVRVSSIVPGGFGAAKNLCNHATVAQGDPEKLEVDADLRKDIDGFAEQVGRMTRERERERKRERERERCGRESKRE